MVNYNIHFLKGQTHITDEVYAKETGLPLHYAGTPKINCKYEGTEEELRKYYANAGILVDEDDET